LYTREPEDELLACIAELASSSVPSVSTQAPTNDDLKLDASRKTILHRSHQHHHRQDDDVSDDGNNFGVASVELVSSCNVIAGFDENIANPKSASKFCENESYLNNNTLVAESIDEMDDDDDQGNEDNEEVDEGDDGNGNRIKIDVANDIRIQDIGDSSSDCSSSSSSSSCSTSSSIPEVVTDAIIESIDNPTIKPRKTIDSNQVINLLESIFRLLKY